MQLEAPFKTAGIVKHHSIKGIKYSTCGKHHARNVRQKEASLIHIKPNNSYFKSSYILYFAFQSKGEHR